MFSLKKLHIEWKTAARGWLFFSLVAGLFFLLPVLYIIVSASHPVGEQWAVISSLVLPEYVVNTLILLLGTLALTFIMGVSTAWLVANYKFPGRTIFKGGLLLPLAFPTYILAYIVGGIFDSTGSLRSLLIHAGFTSPDEAWHLSVFHPAVLIVILSLALYPYVYASALASFSLQSANFLETARSLGKKPFTVFFRVGIPLSRPAIFGGLFLVAMEVLNEYGAVKYFNYKTLTSGIFSTWQLNDLPAASRLALLLLCFVLVFLIIERKSRGKKGYSNVSRSKPIEPIQLKGVRKWGAFSICMLPFLFGFIIPLVQLLFWSLNNLKLFDLKFFIVSWNSFAIAILIALCVVLVAFLINYSAFYNRQGWMSKLGKRWGNFGYAMPGAVVAIGIMALFVALDNTLGIALLNAGFTALFLAYLIRFFAVASGPIDGNIQKIGTSKLEASKNLGKSSWFTLWKVKLPMFRPVLVAAVILVTIDILKELPLTLILRPMNFNTLATRTYDLAQTYESAEMAAPYAFFIVVLSILPLLFLNKLLSR